MTSRNSMDRSKEYHRRDKNAGLTRLPLVQPMKSATRRDRPHGRHEGTGPGSPPPSSPGCPNLLRSRRRTIDMRRSPSHGKGFPRCKGIPFLIALSGHRRSVCCWSSPALMVAVLWLRTSGRRTNCGTVPVVCFRESSERRLLNLWATTSSLKDGRGAALDSPRTLSSLAASVAPRAWSGALHIRAAVRESRCRLYSRRTIRCWSAGSPPERLTSTATRRFHHTPRFPADPEKVDGDSPDPDDEPTAGGTFTYREGSRQKSPI